MADASGQEALQRRVAALEADHFEIVDQLRRIGDKTERHAASLDDLEDLLEQIAAVNANAGAMAEALQQRDISLNAPDPGYPDPPGPFAFPSSEQHGEANPGAGTSPEPDIEQLYAWVSVHVAPLVRKTTTTGEGGGLRWCRMWTEHGDAVTRFRALYLAWHELSEDESATWLSVFLRDHLDPHLSVLTSPVGPFYACSPRKHTDTGEELGQTPAAATESAGGSQ
ncbi:DUF4913 domain-containing protein [Amycolatopsis sp. WGS_07]|uniref:DUF4913 domain-containing protein n=1 Tax=Amycolatopsis sp. WGS_07 TaxID=3076764 RepID=UPI003873B614